MSSNPLIFKNISMTIILCLSRHLDSPRFFNAMPLSPPFAKGGIGDIVASSGCRLKAPKNMNPCRMGSPCNGLEIGGPISPGNYMIKRAGKLNPCFPCHVIAIAKIEPDCQSLFSLTWNPGPLEWTQAGSSGPGSLLFLCLTLDVEL